VFLGLFAPESRGGVASRKGNPELICLLREETFQDRRLYYESAMRQGWEPDGRKRLRVRSRQPGRVKRGDAHGYDLQDLWKRMRGNCSPTTKSVISGTNAAFQKFVRANPRAGLCPRGGDVSGLSARAWKQAVDNDSNCMELGV
jgi:hypothetical protein